MVDSVSDCRVVLTDLLHCPSDLERFGLSLENLKAVPVLNSNFSPDHDNNKPEGLSNKDESVVAVGQFVCSCGEYFDVASALVKHSLEDPRHSDKRLLDRFACPICDRNFAVKKVLYGHVRYAHGVKQFSCDKCFKKYVQRRNLMLHQEKHKKECNICHRRFKTDKSLVDHLNIQAKLGSCPNNKRTREIDEEYNVLTNNVMENNMDAAQTLFECVCCDEKFQSFKTLQMHIRLVPRKGHSTCKICKSNYSCETNNYRMRLLIRHALSHTVDCSGRLLMTFSCRVCRKVTDNLPSLLNHERVHTAKKIHECSVCHIKFTTKIELYVHCKSHPGFKPFTCETCGAGYKSRGSRDRHRMLHKGLIFSCDYCKDTFKLKEQLKQHVLTHMEHHPFTCSTCGVKRISKHSLNQHQRTHMPKKFECPLCSHSCVSANLLELHHRKRHLMSKNFMCNVCDKPFWESGELKLHLEVAHEGKRYECKLCAKLFTRKNHLKSHVDIVHAGAVRVRIRYRYEYECLECGKKVVNLRQHMRTHRKSTCCDECKRSFTTVKGLSAHMRAHKGKHNHTCQHCHLSFATHNLLINHLSNHCEFKPQDSSQNGSLQCNCCNKMFPTMTGLKVHLETVVSGT